MLLLQLLHSVEVLGWETEETGDQVVLIVLFKVVNAFQSRIVDLRLLVELGLHLLIF